MPAAAWAARSGDPVLFAAGDELPKSDRGGAAPPPARPRSTCSGPPRRSPPPSCGSRRDRPSGAAGRRRRPGRKRDRLRPLPPRRLRLEHQRPGHGFVVARSDSPLDAAAAAPLSASGTWGPLLLSDDADTLPEAAPRVPARRQAGLHHGPDPRVLQPRLGDRRPGGDIGGTTGRNRQPGRAGQDRREVP